MPYLHQITNGSFLATGMSVWIFALMLIASLSFFESTVAVGNVMTADTPLEIKDLQAANKPATTILAIASPKGDESIQPVDLSTSLTYEDCIRHALLQSPSFKKSTIQIKIDRIGERDACWKMFPNLDITGIFTRNDPSQHQLSPFRANFTVGSWDPILGYFSIKAHKLLTKIAVYKHLKNIADGLFNIADAFLRLECTDKIAVLINEIIDLTERDKVYVLNLYQSGKVSNLDVKTVEHKINQLAMQRQQNDCKRLDALESVKKIIGVSQSQNLIIQSQNSRSQVLGSFDPAAATLEMAQHNCIELKIKALEKELQRYNIIAAYAQYIPKIQFSFHSNYPSYNYNDKDSDSLMSSIGFTTPLWDWGARWRDIKREKYKTGGVEADTMEKELTLIGDWRKAEMDRKKNACELELAYSALELSKLKRQQAEIRYKSGTETYTRYLESIKAFYESQITTLNVELQHSGMLLKLRHITGDLYRSYVDVTAS